MKKVWIAVLVILGLLAVMMVVLVVAVGLFSQSGKGRVARNTVLEADFERGMIETITNDPLDKLMRGHMPTVRGTVESIRAGADDRRVTGLIARIGAAPMSLAAIQEVRDAVLHFRESGKPAIAWAETFGEFGPGNGAYYLATAFDEVYLQPSGDIGLTGFVYETSFLRGTLDKLGITPVMDKRHEYKNAANSYTETEFTEPHREALERVMVSRFEQMVRDVGEARGIAEDELRSLIDRGPYLGREAVDAGLVDGLAYRDEVYEKIREAAGSSSRLLYLSKYLKRSGSRSRRGESVALIYGVGAVVRGDGGFDPWSGEQFMGSDTVGAAFRAAVEDDRVRAIVFRVDSPGGSYVASDTIWRETIRAREAGKPVIVSMGNLAGSGGYFVAMSADRIVAQPSTITGSIGVYAGKMLTREMWGKIGMTFDEVHTSANSRIWSSLHDYGPTEHERFQASLDRIYEDFTRKVSEGRSLEHDDVLDIARGRIWTGADALDIGLVDALGGFDVAIELAKEEAGIDPEADVRLKVFPRPRSTWDAFFGGKPDSSEAALASLARGLEAVQPWVRTMRRVALGRASGVLSMPLLPATE
jgi:protease-4